MTPTVSCSITVGPKTSLQLPSSKGIEAGYFCGCVTSPDFFIHGAIPDVRRFASELLAECDRLEAERKAAA